MPEKIYKDKLKELTDEELLAQVPGRMPVLPDNGDIAQPETPVLAAPEQTYFARRMEELGVTDENNVIELWQSTTFDSEHGGNDIKVKKPVFVASDRGIDIRVYYLNRNPIRTTTDLQRNGLTIKAKDKEYFITRLEQPIVTKSGGEMKYTKPKGVPSYPFFPPRLVQKYDEKQPLEILYITEGFFKAFKADLHGINCVGVQSITCLRDKETNALWEDITTLVKACKVQRLVWLTDGDMMNITSKEITDSIDLYKRPFGFYSSVYTFYELTSDLKDTDRYFAHINTEDLAVPALYKENGPMITPAISGPKGLDDLLISRTDKMQDIITEFNNFSIMAPGKIYPGTYITRINIELGVGRVKEYFKLHDVNAFYQYHVEKRPELKAAGKFIFNGTTYRWDDEKSECAVEIPASASDYMRVGNDYFKKIEKPTKNYQRDGSTIKTITGRMKGTITDDHGKKIFEHIVKYNEFTVVPDHTNYQQVIHNCYNLYSPFVHDPEDGSCDSILSFLQHIFGDNEVKGIKMYELALDYISILYKYPQQVLPILCLVSEERQTGKSTFGELIDWIFENNVISIGNEDIKGDFNAHFANKLVIICDETKIDNHEVIQKIKRLSTIDKIVMNAKGKDQVTVPFFAKFILMSNSVDDFIKIDKEEIRFWVHKVPRLDKPDIMLKQKMRDEIPAFIGYLNKRIMVTKNEERHWFKTELLQTEALIKVKENSLSTLEKRIMIEITELFELSPDDTDTVKLPLSELVVLTQQKDKNYVKRMLHKMGKKTLAGRFTYPRRSSRNTGDGLGGPVGTEVYLEAVQMNSTYYMFERKDFIPDADPSQSKEAVEQGNGTDENNAAAADEKLPF